jgi:hypothetical protein
MRTWAAGFCTRGRDGGWARGWVGGGRVQWGVARVMRVGGAGGWGKGGGGVGVGGWGGGTLWADSLGGGLAHIDEDRLEDGGAVVGDGDVARPVGRLQDLVHPLRAKGRLDQVGDRKRAAD